MQKLLHYVIGMQRRLTFKQVAAILKDIKPEQEVEDMRKSVPGATAADDVPACGGSGG